MYSWYSVRVVHEQMVHEAMARKSVHDRTRHMGEQQSGSPWQSLLAHFTRKQGGDLAAQHNPITDNYASATSLRNGAFENFCGQHGYCCEA